MLELFRLARDDDADRVEDALQELVVAHRVTVCSLEEAGAALGAGVTLPALREDGQVFHGAARLAEHLEHTARTMERWRAFQSDSCYLGLGKKLP